MYSGVSCLDVGEGQLAWWNRLGQCWKIAVWMPKITGRKLGDRTKNKATRGLLDLKKLGWCLHWSTPLISSPDGRVTTTIPSVQQRLHGQPLITWLCMLSLLLLSPFIVPYQHWISSLHFSMAYQQARRTAAAHYHNTVCHQVIEEQDHIFELSSPWSSCCAHLLTWRLLQVLCTIGFQQDPIWRIPYAAHTSMEGGTWFSTLDLQSGYWPFGGEGPGWIERRILFSIHQWHHSIFNFMRTSYPTFKRLAQANLLNKEMTL